MVHKLEKEGVARMLRTLHNADDHHGSPPEKNCQDNEKAGLVQHQWPATHGARECGPKQSWTHQGHEGSR